MVRFPMRPYKDPVDLFPRDQISGPFIIFTLADEGTRGVLHHVRLWLV